MPPRLSCAILCHHPDASLRRHLFFAPREIQYLADQLFVDKKTGYKEIQYLRHQPLMARAIFHHPSMFPPWQRMVDVDKKRIADSAVELKTLPFVPDRLPSGVPPRYTRNLSNDLEASRSILELDNDFHLSLQFQPSGVLNTTTLLDGTRISSISSGACPVCS